MIRQDFTRLEEAICHAVTEAIDAFALSLEQRCGKCHRKRESNVHTCGWCGEPWPDAQKETEA